MTLGGSVSYLGIGVKEILAERAKELKLKEEAGVEVTRVDSNSPAEKAGLKAGDAVLEYQGIESKARSSSSVSSAKRHQVGRLS